MTFQAWVDAIVESRYGGRAFRLAEAVGLHQSSFSRGAAKGTLSVESLLKLAQVTGEPPGDVLRLAGKDDVADLLDDLYGTTGATVSRTELRVIQAYRALPKDAQAHWLGMAETHPGRAGAATARAAG